MIRCEKCNHRASDGTWEGPAANVVGPRLGQVAPEVLFREWAKQQANPERPRYDVDFWSRCDAACRHGGPGRITNMAYAIATTPTGNLPRPHHPDCVYDASWRPVKMWTPGGRTLCLRCWVEATNEGEAMTDEAGAGGAHNEPVEQRTEVFMILADLPLEAPKGKGMRYGGRVPFEGGSSIADRRVMMVEALRSLTDHVARGDVDHLLVPDGTPGLGEHDPDSPWFEGTDPRRRMTAADMKP